MAERIYGASFERENGGQRGDWRKYDDVKWLLMTVTRTITITIICVCEVDVNKAGEGELEIMINKGVVPNSVRMISSGVFQVSFVPKEPKPHTVDIKFNSTPLPGTWVQWNAVSGHRICPIRIPQVPKQVKLNRNARSMAATSTESAVPFDDLFLAAILPFSHCLLCVYATVCGHWQPWRRLWWLSVGYERQ